MAHNAAAAVDPGEGLRAPDTSSRHVVESVTHDFQVTNYPLLGGMRVRKYISSSTFAVGGYDWNIVFYPDGDDEDCAGHASAFLCYLSQAKDEVRTNLTFTMLNDQGNVQATHQVPEFIFSTGVENDSLGFPKFVEKSKLKSSSRLLTIRCVLAVIKEPPAECKRYLIVDPPPELSGRLHRALKNGRGTDITLLVGGREFSAHRFMLAARSPVFESLFGPMMDKDTRCVEIADMEPAIFEMLLHYVYTDSLPPCGEGDYDAATMQHLLVGAVRYGLDRLKVMCEKRLCRNIDASTVMSTLALATHHNSDQLKDACLEFISSSREVMDTVVVTDGFQHLMANCPMLDLPKNTGGKVTIKNFWQKFLHKIFQYEHSSKLQKKHHNWGP
ncbi:BTB/POZ and MATH domain-containing protein 1-like [Triticum aestivum]|uniref:BTB/POZ and MATH domain-containing protein 1-like n=1 Tax=Triticum aestivum TaxID=4565 RepID=UPI001D00B133|nr:BTB/POZ and MATH domain-containing protein 1-like [Triticum aestivum]